MEKQLIKGLLPILVSTMACAIEPAVETDDLQGITLEVEAGVFTEEIGLITAQINDATGIVAETTLTPDTGTLEIPTDKGLKSVTINYYETEETDDLLGSEQLKVFVPTGSSPVVTLRAPRTSRRSTVTAGGVPTAYVTSIDLRPEFAARGIGIANQGPRPTCSVHAMTGLLEFAYTGMFGEGYANLSEEYLNYFSQIVAGGTSASHGDGAYFWMAEEAFDSYGITTEASLPYNQSTFHFDLDAEQIDWNMKYYAQRQKAEAEELHGLKGRFLKPNDSRNDLTNYEFDEIKNYLQMGVPVAMGRYHSVILVGYDDSTGRFTYKNSYGGTGYSTYTYNDVRNTCNDLYAYYTKLSDPREFKHDSGSWDVINSDSIFYNGINGTNNALWLNQYISKDDTNQNLRVKFKFMPMTDEYELMIALYRDNPNVTSGWDIFKRQVSIAYNTHGSTSRVSWLRTNHLNNVIKTATPNYYAKNQEHDVEVTVSNDLLTFKINNQVIFNNVSISSLSTDREGYIGFTNYWSMADDSEYYIYDIEIDRF